MDATTITVGAVLALLGGLLAWVVRATRRPPIVRPPSGPPWVPPSVAVDRAAAGELRDEASKLRDEVDDHHRLERAELASERSQLDASTDLEDLLAAGRRHQLEREDP